PLRNFMTFRDLFPQVMLPAWEIGQQLKTKTYRVYGVHSEPPKTRRNRYRRSNIVLTRQKCGRVLNHENSVLRSLPGHFSDLPTIRDLRVINAAASSRE